MSYVDGFVAAVPTANKERYVAFARTLGPLFKECGALSVVDCWGDDVPPGKITSFPLAVKCEPDETVVFGWITWPSKEVRNTGFEKAMADPRMKPENLPMPFDGKRMIFGGFELIAQS